MTHTTDCEVKETDRERVNQWADRIAEENITPDSDLLQEMENAGWEFLGQGAGRVTFRVPREEQDGPGGTPTRDADCVVKFARRGMVGQNAEEVNSYLSLPPELTSERDGELPVMLPVKDWDEDFDWLSMPLADGSEQDDRAVDRRLLEEGWQCSDVKPDNVGSVHGTPVLIDYGMECKESEPATQAANTLFQKLDDIGVRSPTLNVLDVTETFIDFMPPAGMPGSEPPRSTSEITYKVDPRIQREGVSTFDLVFGTWTGSIPTVNELEAGLDDVRSGLEQEHGTDLGIENTAVQMRVLSSGGDKEAVIELDSYRPAFPVDVAVDIYMTIQELVRDEMPADQPVSEEQQRLQDVRGRVERNIQQLVNRQERRREGFHDAQ